MTSDRTCFCVLFFLLMCNLKTMKHIIFADKMKILLLFMTIALLTGCTQTQGILLRNRTNERVKLYCYY